jgi:hypothetical protein
MLAYNPIVEICRLIVTILVRDLAVKETWSRTELTKYPLSYVCEGIAEGRVLVLVAGPSPHVRRGDLLVNEN